MRRTLALLLALILGVAYGRSIAPGLTWAHFSADGADLIVAAATGGVPHPAGYPLYLILAGGFQFLPIGNLAFRTNLLSAVCTLLTALLLYVYLVRQLQHPIAGGLAAFLAATAYGLAPFVWGQALVTEVYALHGLLMMLCLHVLSLPESGIGAWLRGLVFGVAATNHATAILMFPLLALAERGPVWAPPSVLLKRSLAVLAGLLLYLSLPLRAYFHPPINWGNPATLDGFFWLISGQLYRPYLFAVSWTDVLLRMRGFAGMLLEQFTWLGVLVGLYGLMSQPSRRVLIPTLWMAATFLVFSISYGSSDSQVYLLPVWLAFAVWLGHGLHTLLAALLKGPALRVSVAAVLMMALLVRALSLFPSVNLSNDSQATDFIRATLQALPQRSIVFVDGDEQLFSLWYAQFALQQRADLAVIAAGLLPYEWYRNNLRDTYADLKIPADARPRTSDLAALNPGRPVCFVSHEAPLMCRSVP